MSLIDSKWLKENNYHLFHYEPMGSGKEGVVEVDVDTIPTTWIPCSERMPEEYGEYLVTKRTIGWNCEEYDVNDIAYFDDDGFHKADRVIAWMPLPTDRPKEVQP